jgi:hypothetical protein
MTRGNSGKGCQAFRAEERSFRVRSRGSDTRAAWPFVICAGPFCLPAASSPQKLLAWLPEQR